MNVLEYILLFNPILFLLINLMLNQTVMSGIRGINKTIDWDAYTKQINAETYPIYMELGFIISGGLFVITFMKDRFHGLRYILNFTGVRPIAYITGLMFAEMTLCLAPIILCISVGVMLGIDTFKRHFFELVFAMICFSYPYIQLNFLFSYPVAWCAGRSTKGVDQVFKYILVPNLIVYALALYLTTRTGDNSGAHDSYANFIFLFSSLTSALKYLVNNTTSDDGFMLGDIMKYCVSMLVQGFVFMVINIYLDYYNSVYYKGADNLEETTMRK